MAKAGIVYAGSDDGLVVYSDPGGIGRWRRVHHVMEGHAVVAIKALDALTLLIAVESMGAQRSDDGGQSWYSAPDADADALAAAAATLAANGVATAQGPVQRSVPGVHDATALALLAGKTDTLIAASDGGITLQRSDDGGATWEPAQLSTEIRGTVRTIMPARYHMDVVWAGTGGGQLLRSDDRGRSWEQIAEEAAAIRCLAVVRLA